jgi:hypothetical protein
VDQFDQVRLGDEDLVKMGADQAPHFCRVPHVALEEKKKESVHEKEQTQEHTG